MYMTEPLEHKEKCWYCFAPSVHTLTVQSNTHPCNTYPILWGQHVVFHSFLEEHLLVSFHTTLACKGMGYGNVSGVDSYFENGSSYTVHDIVFPCTHPFWHVPDEFGLTFSLSCWNVDTIRVTFASVHKFLNLTQQCIYFVKCMTGFVRCLMCISISHIDCKSCKCFQCLQGLKAIDK